MNITVLGQIKFMSPIKEVKGSDKKLYETFDKR